jgi:hypothetical protein
VVGFRYRKLQKQASDKGFVLNFYPRNFLNWAQSKFTPQIFLQTLSYPIQNPINLLVLECFFLVLEDEMNSVGFFIGIEVFDFLFIRVFGYVAFNWVYKTF